MCCFQTYKWRKHIEEKRRRWRLKNPLDQRGSQSPEQFTDPLQEKQSSGNMGFILVNVYNKSKGMRNENIFQKRVDDIFDSVKKVTLFDDEIILKILDLQYDFENEEDFEEGDFEEETYSRISRHKSGWPHYRN